MSRVKVTASPASMPSARRTWDLGGRRWVSECLSGKIEVFQLLLPRVTFTLIEPKPPAFFPYFFLSSPTSSYRHTRNTTNPCRDTRRLWSEPCISFLQPRILSRQDERLADLVEITYEGSAVEFLHGAGGKVLNSGVVDEVTQCSTRAGAGKRIDLFLVAIPRSGT